MDLFSLPDIAIDYLGRMEVMSSPLLASFVCIEYLQSVAVTIVS